MRLWELFAGLVLLIGLVLGVGGCAISAEQRQAMIVEREKELGDAWIAAHPGETMTPEIKAKIHDDAVKEVDAAIKTYQTKQKAAVAEKLGEAAAQGASGNLVGAGLAVGAAVLLFLGVGGPKKVMTLVKGGTAV